MRSTCEARAAGLRPSAHPVERLHRGCANQRVAIGERLLEEFLVRRTDAAQQGDGGRTDDAAHLFSLIGGIGVGVATSRSICSVLLQMITRRRTTLDRGKCLRKVRFLLAFGAVPLDDLSGRPLRGLVLLRVTRPAGVRRPERDAQIGARHSML